MINPDQKPNIFSLNPIRFHFLLVLLNISWEIIFVCDCLLRSQILSPVPCVLCSPPNFCLKRDFIKSEWAQTEGGISNVFLQIFSPSLSTSGSWLRRGNFSKTPPGKILKWTNRSCHWKYWQASKDIIEQILNILHLIKVFK